MGTGRPGGAYARYGPAWGALSQEESGVSIAYMASGGAAADILLIEQGAAQLGMTTVTVADQARSGSAEWTAGVKFNAFRALFPMFPSVLQIAVTPESGLMSLRQLSNRRIGVGPDGGSGSAALPAILASLGIAPGSFATGDYMRQIREMLNGTLDACAFIGAPPLPAIQSAAMQHRLTMIGFTREETVQVAAVTPGWTAMTLPAGIFANQTKAICSVGTANFAIGAVSLPDRLAAVLTIAAMRNQRKLAAIVPAVAGSPAPMLVARGEMTFHPGAAQALHALGMDIPAKFIES
jgi:TRAP transporter TAXI family solute receptor